MSGSLDFTMPVRLCNIWLNRLQIWEFAAFTCSLNSDSIYNPRAYEQSRYIVVIGMQMCSVDSVQRA